MCLNSLTKLLNMKTLQLIVGTFMLMTFAVNSAISQSTQDPNGYEIILVVLHQGVEEVRVIGTNSEVSATPYKNKLGPKDSTKEIVLRNVLAELYKEGWKIESANTEEYKTIYMLARKI